MMYYSVRQILTMHFLMGIGFAVAGAAYAKYKARGRRLLTFGGDVFSLGVPQLWLRWYVAAFLFEFLTSFAPGHGMVMYYEVSLSFIEAGALVCGAFLVDRALLLIEP